MRERAATAHPDAEALAHLARGPVGADHIVGEDHFFRRKAGHGRGREDAIGGLLEGHELGLEGDFGAEGARMPHQDRFHAILARRADLRRR
jgi:hypothetical protein